MNKSSLIIALVILAMGFAGGFYAAKKSLHAETITVIKHDTTVVTNEVIVEVPKLVERHTVDSVFIPVETVVYRDSLVYVQLPREQAYYSDTLYQAWVSGYEPRLDSLHIQQKEVYINTIIHESAKRKRFNISISAGYGMGKDGLTPIVAVTGGYTLLSF